MDVISSVYWWGVEMEREEALKTLLHYPQNDYKAIQV